MQQFDAALRSAGIRADEPLTPVLDAWKRGMAWQGELAAQTAQATVAVQETLEQFIAGLPNTPLMTAAGEGRLVERVSERAASVVAHNMTRGVWEMRKRTVLSVAGIAAVTLLVTAGAAWVWGRSSASVSLYIAPGTLVAACTGDAVRVIDGSPVCGVWVRMDQVTALVPPAPAGRK